MFQIKNNILWLSQLKIVILPILILNCSTLLAQVSPNTCLLHLRFTSVNMDTANVDVVEKVACGNSVALDAKPYQLKEVLLQKDIIVGALYEVVVLEELLFNSQKKRYRIIKLKQIEN